MKIRRALFICQLACSFPIFVAAQQTLPTSVDIRTFQNAKESFQLKNYSSAHEFLKAFVRQNEPTDLLQEAEYMLACTSYELNESNRIAQLRSYLAKYPDSRHANRVNALISSAYYFDKEYHKAITAFGYCKPYLLGDDECQDMTYRVALANLKVGNIEEASTWFTTLKYTGKRYYYDCIYYLAYIAYSHKEYQPALREFLSLKDNAVYGELASSFIGDIYLKYQRYADAKSVAEQYLSKYPNGAQRYEMQRILGEAFYNNGDFNKAVESFVIYRNGVKNPAREALYLLGLSYYELNVYSDATQSLGEVVYINDALAQNAYLHLGYSYLQMLDKNKARMAFEQASNANYDLKVKEKAFYNYALCIHETSYSAFGESVKVFERFLNEYPNSVYAEKVSDYLVEVYVNTKSYDAALKSIEKISRPSTRILEAKQNVLFQLGTQCFANANFDAALGYFERSLKVSQYNIQTKADTYYWWGESKYRQSDFVQAAQGLQNYLQYTQNRNNEMYALAHYNLGYAYFKQKQYSVALSWFLKYASLQKGETGKTVIADTYNRLGDCYFYNREFVAARQNYSKAVSVDSSMGDYSLYQQGFIAGLQKNYADKVSFLDQLMSQYPSSQYVDDALYEKGRAYVFNGNNQQAIAAFKELVERFPTSSMSRKGASEIGLLYYQADKYEEAINAYKKVISNYSGSDEARLALRDLKSIYIDLNNVDEYVAFAKSVSGLDSLDDAEQDSITYLAAEKVYMKGNTDKAKEGFLTYLQKYPTGSFSTNAHFYLCSLFLAEKNSEAALLHSAKVLETPDNQFSEEAMIIRADLLYEAKSYQEALTVFHLLKNKATSPQNMIHAQIGILRSAYFAAENREVLLAVTALLDNKKLSPELINEATYYRAKVCLSQQEMKEATKDLKTLAKDTRTVYGAEARYLLAQLYFNTGQTALAEKEILDYIDESTPHAYWLARSFVLLSDVYMKMNKKLDAQQYLLSLQQNYTEKDDIQEMIESRLKQLK